MGHWQKCNVVLVWVAVTLCVGVTRGWTQQETPSKSVSLGVQTASVVLKHYARNPAALDPKTEQPLQSNGNWFISKVPPAACPETKNACVEVFYEVPAESVRCSWVVLLKADGSDGAFLEENDDSERYLMRVVSKAEAKTLVNTRNNPIFPPIAIAVRVMGDVIVEAVVDKSGAVQKALVVSGPPIVQQASVNAAVKWTFKPLMVGTRAVPYKVKLVFRFRTMGSPSASGDLAP